MKPKYAELNFDFLNGEIASSATGIFAPSVTDPFSFSFQFTDLISLVTFFELELTSELSAQIVFGLDEAGNFFPIALATFPAFQRPSGLRHLIGEHRIEQAKCLVVRNKSGLYRVQTEFNDHRDDLTLNPAKIILTHPVQERIPHLRALFISEIILKWIADQKSAAPTSWGMVLKQFLHTLSTKVNASVKKNPQRHSAIRLPTTFENEIYEKAERARRHVAIFIGLFIFTLGAAGFITMKNTLVGINPDYDRGIDLYRAGNFTESVRFFQMAAEKSCKADAPCFFIRIPLARAFQKLGRLADEKKVLETVFSRGMPAYASKVPLCAGWVEVLVEARGRLDFLYRANLVTAKAQ